MGAEIATPKKVAGTGVPNATLQPVAQARSLAMLSQVVMQLEHYVQSKDLSAIPMNGKNFNRGLRG